MSDYKQPCSDHIELRVKTEKDIAVMQEQMSAHIRSLDDSAKVMTRCTIQMAEQVDIMKAYNAEMDRHEDRLKSYEKRLRSHVLMIMAAYAGLGGLTVSGVTVAMVVVSHHPGAIKFLTKLPLFG